MQSAEGGAGSPLIRAIERGAAAIARVADQLSAFVCAVLIVVTTVAMTAYQAGMAVAWLDDVLRMLLIWLVYLGTVSLSLRNDHITMDAAYLRMPPRARRFVDVFVALLGLALCVMVAKIGIDSLRVTLEFDEQLPSGFLPAWPQSLAIPLCFTLMAISYLAHLIRVLSGRHVPPGAAANP